MTYSSQSFITIDSFTLYDLFHFTDDQAIMIQSQTRVYNGDMYASVRVVKDKFKVNFSKLESSEYYALNLICRATGASSLHTVEYGGYGPSRADQTRKYDGTTAYTPGTGVNDDVQRLRKKCKIISFELKHWPGFADIYMGSVEFEEA